MTTTKGRKVAEQFWFDWLYEHVSFAFISYFTIRAWRPTKQHTNWQITSLEPIAIFMLSLLYTKPIFLSPIELYTIFTFSFHITYHLLYNTARDFCDTMCVLISQTDQLSQLPVCEPGTRLEGNYFFLFLKILVCSSL